MRAKFPQAEYTMLVRTWFGDEPEWERLLGVIGTPSLEGFTANVGIMSDLTNAGVSPAEIMEMVPNELNSGLVVIADYVTFHNPCLPLLMVDLVGIRGRSFRVAAAVLWSAENNLSTANRDFEEFTEALDESDVFQGW